MLSEAGVDNSFAKKKVREWNAKAQDFTDKTGIPRQKAREKVFTSGGNGDIIKTQGFAINPEKQSRHIKSSPNYKKGKSYLLDDGSHAQEIVNNYSGTGIKIGSSKEKVNTDKIIGVNVNTVKGYKTLTDSAVIHYSKSGTHVVPTSNKIKTSSVADLKLQAKKVAMEYYDTPDYLKFTTGGKLLDPTEKELRINMLLSGKQSKRNLLKDIKSMEKKILKSRGDIK